MHAFFHIRESMVLKVLLTWTNKKWKRWEAVGGSITLKRKKVMHDKVESTCVWTTRHGDFFFFFKFECVLYWGEGRWFELDVCNYIAYNNSNLVWSSSGFRNFIPIFSLPICQVYCMLSCTTSETIWSPLSSGRAYVHVTSGTVPHGHQMGGCIVPCSVDPHCRVLCIFEWPTAIKWHVSCMTACRFDCPVFFILFIKNK